MSNLYSDQGENSALPKLSSMDSLRSEDYLNKFPKIIDNFEIIDKIGQGSFAAVFLVKSKAYPELKEKFALKFTIPVSDPKRIENELRILKKIGGRKNVVKLQYAFRIEDHIFMLLAYVDPGRFSDYYLKMDINEIREYLRNLLIALNHVHANQIVHRDVKPNNFLYDRKMKKFALVDFGLAHSENHSDLGEWFNDPKKFDLSNENISVTSLNSSQTDQTASLNVFCVCSNQLSTCSACRNKPRPRAHGGGTIGYRPPEVIMRHLHQTTAVDVWAVGIIMGMFLTGNYPFFKAEDDIEILYSLVYFLSFEKMEEAAKEYEKTIVVDPKPKALVGDSITWLQSRCSYMRKRCARVLKLFNEKTKKECVYGPNQEFEYLAFDLLSRLLDPICTTRITCKEALEHKFFKTNRKRNLK